MTSSGARSLGSETLVVRRMGTCVSDQVHTLTMTVERRGECNYNPVSIISKYLLIY